MKKFIVNCPICEKVLCTIDEQTFKDKYQDYVCDYCKETLSSKRRLELEQEMMSNEDYIKMINEPKLLWKSYLKPATKLNFSKLS